MKTIKSINALAAAVGCVLAGYSTQTAASGFALIEQGVSGMGTAHAGGAAQAEDATTVFFNPAGLTRLPGAQFIAGAHVVLPQSEFDDEGSSHLLLGPGGLGTSDGGDSGVDSVVPHLYYARQLTDRAFFGLGINAPFGLSTEYGRDWIGRYHAVRSEVTTVNFNPALAFKATERLSIGAGINIQYIDAELTNAIDFGTLNALSLGLGGFGGAFPGLVPGASDGFVEVDGDDWSLGYNVGLLFGVNEGTRLGLHYRSSIKHDLDGGKADFDVPGGGVIEAGTGRFRDTGVQATVRLPESLSASVYHDLNPAWGIMADVTWTNWDRLPELRFEFDNPLQPDGVTTLEWEDTFRYSIGVTHTPDSRWTYRTGVAYDEDPVPSAELRPARLPGADRLWIAAGLGYKYSDQLSFDFGYAHLFVNDPKIAKTATGEDALRGGLNGKYDAEVDIISAQLRWIF